MGGFATESGALPPLPIEEGVSAGAEGEVDILDPQQNGGTVRRMNLSIAHNWSWVMLGNSKCCSGATDIRQESWSSA